MRMPQGASPVLTISAPEHIGPAALPRILIVSLGGTITMTGSDGAGIAPTLTAKDLIAAVPQLKEIAQIEALSMLGLPGSSLTLRHLVEIAELLRERFANDQADGAVVVQGTDTIEDTAFVLDLLVGAGHPVVVTGAMRGPQTHGADGPANLFAAVRAAGDQQLSTTGVVVVLNDEIHAARFVQKAHTTLVNSFESPTTGPLGTVVQGRIELLLKPAHVWHRVDPLPARAGNVAVVSLGLGEDGRMLAVLSGLGYQGAVIEGMWAGHVPSSAVDSIAALVETMPVVLCTRVKAGRVFDRTYGFPGSEMDLIQRGVIPSGVLGTSKSRLLLAILIGAGFSSSEVRSAFALHGNG